MSAGRRAAVVAAAGAGRVFTAEYNQAMRKFFAAVALLAGGASVMLAQSKPVQPPPDTKPEGVLMAPQAPLDERPRERCSLLRRNRSIPISKGRAWLIQRFTAHVAMVAVLLATVVG